MPVLGKLLDRVVNEFFGEKTPCVEMKLETMVKLTP
jgi:hypothetical protein